MADFSGIDSKHETVIGDLLHGAMIDVDEFGVEAAAATVAVLRAGAAFPRADPVVVRAERPFAFGIRDRRTGLLLFTGQLTNPRAGS